MSSDSVAEQLKKANYPAAVFATSKDGQLGIIPEHQAEAAKGQGYTIHEPGVYMTDPTGKLGLVPRSQSAAALKRGYQVGLPQKDHPELYKSTSSDLANAALQQQGLSVSDPSAPQPKMLQVDPLNGASVPAQDQDTDQTLPWDIPGQIKAGAKNFNRITGTPWEIAKRQMKKVANVPLSGATIPDVSAGPSHMSLGGNKPVTLTPEQMTALNRDVINPVGEASADFGQGMTTAESVALLGAGRLRGANAAARTIATGANTALAAPMIPGAGQKLGEGIAQAEQGNYPEATRNIAGAAYDTAFAADMGRQILHPANVKQTAQDVGEVANRALQTPPVRAISRGAGKVAETTGDAIQGVRAAWNPEKNLTNVQAATKAWRPRNSKANWKQELATALPDAKRAAESLGINVEEMKLEDSLRATGKAKKDVWAEYVQNFLDPAVAANAKVDGNMIADAMESTITDRMRAQKPGLVKQILRTAATYRGKMLTVDQAQDYLTEANIETSNIEMKYPAAKRTAKQTPQNAYKFAERDTLRRGLDQTLESVAGQGGPDLRRRWGNLNSMEDTIQRRIPVADRSNPISLTRILQLVHGPARVLRGAFSGNAGDVMMGVYNTRQLMNAEKMADPEWLTQQAFKKTQATPPPQVSGEYMPNPPETGAYSPLVPRFLRPALPPSMREQGVPEQPNVDAVDNREYGDSVTPLGSRGEAGTMVRPKGQLPEGVVLPPQRKALPPISLFQRNAPQRNNVEAVGIPETAEASALQKHYQDHPDVPGAKVVGLDADSGLPIVKREQPSASIVASTESNKPNNLASRGEVAQESRVPVAEQSQAPREQGGLKIGENTPEWQRFDRMMKGEVSPEDQSLYQDAIDKDARVAQRVGIKPDPRAAVMGVLRDAGVHDNVLPEKADAVLAKLQPRTPVEPIPEKGATVPTPSTESPKAPTGTGIPSFLRAGKTTEEAKTNLPGRPSENVRMVSTKDLLVDPKEMQWRILPRNSINPSEPWNQAKAGPVDVWWNPERQKWQVVDGHHRINHALRTNTPEIEARVQNFDSVKAAKTFGALRNIENGNATPFDAALYFRESGMTPEGLREHGVNPEAEMVQKASALARLSNQLWEQYRAGNLDEAKAVAIGQHLSDPSQQKVLADMAIKNRMSAPEIEQMARRVKEAGSTSQGSESLFGTDEKSQSNFVEIARVASKIEKQLQTDKTALRFIANAPEARKQALARAENIINVDKSSQEAMIAATLAEGFRRLQNRTGRVRQLLDEAGARITRGEKRDAVYNEVYPQIREAILQEIGGTGSGVESAGKRADSGSNGESPKVGQPEESEGPVTPEGAGDLFRIAYHGSPYKFDKFTLDKIGSGEGAQAYGWGLYFAGDRSIAEYYRESLSSREPRNAMLLDGKPIVGSDHPTLYRALSFVRSGETLEQAIDSLKQQAVFAKKAYGPGSAELYEHAVEILEKYKDRITVGKPGQLYEVDIPEHDTMLDWDKPLSEQPRTVRETIKNVLDDIVNRSDWKTASALTRKFDSQEFHEKTTGEDFYKLIASIEAGKKYPGAENTRDDEAASRYLHSLGIDGIKYLDGGSRAKGEGSHNYVVFNDNAIKIMNRSGDLMRSAGPETETPQFKQWFGESKVRDEQGKPVVVYRGDYRADRVGNKFKVNRATSGRFYFTEDPEIASRYSQDKPDHNFVDENQNFANWFKFPELRYKGERTVPDLERAWYRLSPEQKARVQNVIENTTMDDQGDFVFDAGESIYPNNDFPRLLREHRGNWLKLAEDIWMSSGNLFDREADFTKILKKAGLDAEYDNPNDQRSVVTPVYLSIKNPLDTSNIPANVITALERVAKSDRTRPAKFGADDWDKSVRTSKVFIERLRDDLKNGTTYAWTTMPEKITKALQEMGYDGVKDTGGKNGGQKHNVWIAFEPNQIKSATGNRGTFDPNSDNILHRAGNEGATSRDYTKAEADYHPPAGARPARIALNEEAMNIFKWARGIKANLNVEGLNTATGTAQYILNRLNFLAKYATDAHRPVIRKLASVVERAIRDADPEQGINIFDRNKPEAEAEETVHSGQRKAGKGSLESGVPHEAMAKHPAFRAMAERIRRETGKNFSPMVQVAEGYNDLVTDEAPEIHPDDVRGALEDHYRAVVEKAGIEGLENGYARQLAALRDIFAERGHNLPQGVEDAEQAIEAVRSSHQGSQGPVSKDQPSTGGGRPSESGGVDRATGDVAGRDLERPNGYGLDNQELESWVQSARSIHVQEAGEQNNLFGEPEKMFRLIRANADGLIESTLVTEAQYERLKNYKPFKKAEAKGSQGSLYDAQDASGEILGSQAKNAITLPPQASKSQGTLFRAKTESVKNSDYRGEHSAPDSDSAPAHDLTGNGVYPADVYGPNGTRYYGDGTNLDAESFSIVNSIKGRPNATVRIYRAVPEILTNSKKIAKFEDQKRFMLRHGRLPKDAEPGDWKNYSAYYDWVSDQIDALKSAPEMSVTKPEINPGDWVTINKRYAREHGESALHGKYKILSKTVHARDIFTNGDSIHEWGYNPQPNQSIPPFLRKANKGRK